MKGVSGDQQQDSLSALLAVRFGPFGRKIKKIKKNRNASYLLLSIFFFFFFNVISLQESAIDCE